MAHVAFVVPPFLGHINPSVALARALERRDHRTTFLHMADAEPVLAARGIAFHPVGRSTHPPGALGPILHRMATVHGFWGLPGIIRDVCAATDMLCRDLPDALRAIGADLLVCDAAEAAGGLVADHLGLPLVSLANALPLNREPAVPPPFVGWRYDPSPWGLERNKGGYRVSDLLMGSHRKVIAGWAERWRLGPRPGLDDCLSRLAQISQLVPGFDMPRHELPDSFHYCGPLRELVSVEETAFRLPPSDGRPLVYGSLGTLQGRRVRLFRRMAEAARDTRAQLVATHGGGLTAAQANSLSGAPAVFDFVPQAPVLARAQAAILHGGLNTVMDALAAGVPIVAMPIAFEQGAIAARIERAGAGLVVGKGFGLRGRLTRALRRLLHQEEFRAGAKRIQAEIAAAGGAERAADIVERVIATGRSVRGDASLGPRPAERAA